MNEKYITLCNGLLYYLIAPCLLLYFFMIDMRLIAPSFIILLVFGILIIIGVSIPMIYKKSNDNYSFNVNSLYGKIMSILVIFELSYNFL